METYTVHTAENAPADSRPILAKVQDKYGFVPNVFGVLAESPAALAAYTAIGAALDSGSLTPAEQQVVLIATSVANGCTYCVAAHSTVASMQEVPAPVVTAVRDGAPVADAKLEALHDFTLAVVNGRGWANKEAVAAFFNAGYNKAQLLEVVTAISLKTLSNYTNHLTDTPLDDAFGGCAWSPKEGAASA